MEFCLQKQYLGNSNLANMTNFVSYITIVFLDKQKGTIAFQ